MLLYRDVTLSRFRTNGDLLRRDLIALGFNSWEFLGFDKFEKIFFSSIYSKVMVILITYL